ncbi:MAG: LytS/YhcK type 5TM receptor domain-containing protein [Methanomicrobiales archaeon]
MTLSILTQLNVLLQLMCVIIVAAYLLTRNRIFPEILDGHATLIDKIILVQLFGGHSIYGSVSGIKFMGSVVNVRDLGPKLAGLLAGPWVGLGTWLIGSTFHLTIGGSHDRHLFRSSTICRPLWQDPRALEKEAIYRHEDCSDSRHPDGILPHCARSPDCHPSSMQILPLSREYISR